MKQLPLFQDPGTGAVEIVPTWLCEPPETPDDLLGLGTLELLALNPLLIDITPDATGVMSQPEWGSVYATANLLDTLGVGDEASLYDVLARANLELKLADGQSQYITFRHSIRDALFWLEVVIRRDCQPHAAIIGLALDFPTEK